MYSKYAAPLGEGSGSVPGRPKPKTTAVHWRRGSAGRANHTEGKPKVHWDIFADDVANSGESDQESEVRELTETGRGGGGRFFVLNEAHTLHVLHSTYF